MEFHLIMLQFMQMNQLLTQILERSNTTMASVQDVMNKTDEVLATVRAEREEVQAKLADLSEQLQTLTDSIAVGGVASPDQLADIVNRLQNVTDEIKNISEPLPPVPADPEPQEPADTPEEPVENANDPVLQQPLEDREPKADEVPAS